MKRFTPEEDKYIQDNYLTETFTEIGVKLNRSVGTICSRATLLGCILPKKIKAARRRILPKNPGGRFEKGHIPANKGKVMPESVKQKIKHTFFPSGNKPHNTKHDGYISIRGQYKYIRISEGNWQLLHQHNWEKRYGKVPEEMIINFKDGNSHNCEIENLKLINRSQNMNNNSIMRYPEPLRKAIHKVAKIDRLTK